MRLQYTTGNNKNGETASISQLSDLVNLSVHSISSDHFQLNHPKISAVIITYNEEAIIKQTLQKLWWCNEIIIIDSGSTDKTTSICEEFGCSVFYRSFEGFGEQKKYGVLKASNDWILCIDADEILTDELIEELRKEISSDNLSFAGYSMPRNLVFMNKVFNHGKESTASITRLFNRKHGNWDGAVVHEKLILDGPIKKLKNKILHYSYKDYNQFLAKINLYSSLGARKMIDNKNSKGKLLVTIAIPFNFLKYYIYDRNFLNGYYGFSWSILNTFYHFVKYMKLNELKKAR
jgi:glycosyltransferase involved in cell wall biosynthesis